MINATTPFLNRDGTVSREWFQFLSTLNVAVGGTTVINITSVPDVQNLQEVDEALDLSPQVPGIQSRALSDNVLLWLSS